MVTASRARIEKGEILKVPARPGFGVVVRMPGDGWAVLRAPPAGIVVVDRMIGTSGNQHRLQINEYFAIAPTAARNEPIRFVLGNQEGQWLNVSIQAPR